METPGAAPDTRLTHYRLQQIVCGVTSSVSSIVTDMVEPLFVINLSYRGHETTLRIEIDDGAGEFSSSASSGIVWHVVLLLLLLPSQRCCHSYSFIVLAFAVLWFEFWPSSNVFFM